ncbi:hypothetical protein BDZ91DRAFT_721777 [Kalaharituber pfeilii]|nr:hypothetical protein BDZ91DRAFT_721777 [Kalaharituber pfeilii]
MSKAPKVWLITSATSPLGYAVAYKALQEGNYVALGCRRDEVVEDVGFVEALMRRVRGEGNGESEVENRESEVEDREMGKEAGMGDGGKGEGDGDVDMREHSGALVGLGGEGGEEACGSGNRSSSSSSGGGGSGGSKTSSRSDTSPADPRLTQQISLSRLHRAFPSRSIIVELDTRSIPLCQSSLSQTVSSFGRVDVLLVCSTKTYVGCIEEIPLQSILAQFESATFATFNMLRAGLPVVRRQRKGHFVVVTGTTGGMGTPALGLRCAADHAVEGFCDALAFEVAPFGVRVSVVQPPVEVKYRPIKPHHYLPRPPRLRQYPQHPASFVRNLISKTHPTPLPTTTSKITNTTEYVPTPVNYPSPTHLSSLLPILAETVHIITSIAGTEDPPGRIVVGNENAEQVKERLKAVSEELEDYLEASGGHQGGKRDGG